MIVKEISFEEVKPLWNLLWPNRDLRPLSSMTFPSGYNMAIYDRYKPTFFGAYIDEILVGVNSGFKSSQSHYRSRGLYTLPAYRGKGIGVSILTKTIDQARYENCEMIWTLPRKESFSVYKRAGFEQVTDWFSEGMDYGINCYAVIYF
jgi:GNAT superfamily N-acetyltransferase